MKGVVRLKHSLAAVLCGVLVGAWMTGCGTSEEPPGCTLASSHYYEAGCSFINLESGADIPLGEWVSSCREVDAIATGSRCEDEMDDLLFCLDDVPNPAVEADCVACNVELDRLLSCQP